MDNNPHYFWAVRLPDVMKQYISTELEKVKDHFSFKRWVHEQDYHITLAFLGNAEKDKLDVSMELVYKAISDIPAFSLNLNRIDVFGKKDSPRIFWCGVDYNPGLDKVQSLVYNACSQAGFILEKRPFKPHITLARNWHGAKFQPEILEGFNPFKKDVSYLASEVVLYKTNITNTPKYEPITNFLLKNE